MVALRAAAAAALESEGAKTLKHNIYYNPLTDTRRMQEGCARDV